MRLKAVSTGMHLGLMGAKRSTILNALFKETSVLSCFRPLEQVIRSPSPPEPWKDPV